MILPSEGITYTELYYTMRCNLRCSYCINGQVDRTVPTVPLTEAIKKLRLGDRPLTIGGGEPTIVPSFYDFVNSIPHKIDLLTNGTFNAQEFKANLKPERFNPSPVQAYKSIRISYHTTQDPEELVDKAAYLQGHGYSVGIFGVGHPLSIHYNMVMADLCRRSGVFFWVKEYLGIYDGHSYGHYRYPAGLDGMPKQAQCRSSELLIAPDGQMYRCHYDLYGRQNSIGNVLSYHGHVPYTHRSCNSYGLCNRCDLKIKIDPTLQRSRCSVDVVS